MRNNSWREKAKIINLFCCSKVVDWNMAPPNVAHVGIVFIGGKSTGKSTIMGHYLYQAGFICYRTIDKNLKMSMEILGNPSGKFSWAAGHVRKDEKELKKTIHLKSYNYKTEGMSVSMWDTPGTLSNMKNTIAGIGLSEISIICLSAEPFLNEDIEHQKLEVNIAKEFTLLSYGLKIKRVIFLINKMDQVNYSEVIFNNIKGRVQKMGILMGYKSTFISFIPISGWKGDNLYKISRNMNWYKGSTLFKQITKLKIKRGRISGKKFRMVLHDTYKISGIGTVPCGKVVSGRLHPGIHKNISFIRIPKGSNINNIKSEQIITTQIKHIERCHINQPLALPYDNIGLNIRGVPNYYIKKHGYNHSACGLVLSLGGECLFPAKSILAKIVVLNKRIKKGQNFIIYSHTARAQCRIKDIIQRLGKEGNILPQTQFVELGEFAIIRLIPHPTNFLFIETYADCPRMGTLVMRDHNVTNCIGMVLNIKRARLKE